LNNNNGLSIHHEVETIFRRESRRVLATLIRLLGNFELAEEALQDAFIAAVEQWPQAGIPDHPRAFLITPSTVAQRIVRAKSKIRDAHIPYEVPSHAQLPERLDAVLREVYLVFNEGYFATSGDALTRSDLSSEALRLGRLLVDLLPQAEVVGLLALMLLIESRRPARLSRSGEPVLLDQQDRSQWDRDMIREGEALVEQALRSGRFGAYSVQAAIAAVHAEARYATDTDWQQIVGLYDVLVGLTGSPWRCFTGQKPG